MGTCNSAALLYLTMGAPFPGKPTRFAPMPKPAPVRTLDPMDGANRSSTAKVAAATREISRTSVGSILWPGMKYAATATMMPSKMYLKNRGNI